MSKGLFWTIVIGVILLSLLIYYVLYRKGKAGENWFLWWLVELLIGCAIAFILFRDSLEPFFK